MALSTRYYETFYGVELSSATAYWGRGSYNQQLVKEYPSADTSVVTSRIAVDEAITFLYPFQIDKEYAIEGVVTGHVTLYNMNPTITTHDFNNRRLAYIELEAVSAVIEGGSKTLAKVSLPPEYELPPEDYTVVPFYIDMTNRVYIGPSERLVVTIGSALTDTPTDIRYCFDIDTTNEDFKIKIPFV